MIRTGPGEANESGRGAALEGPVRSERASEVTRGELTLLLLFFFYMFDPDRATRGQAPIVVTPAMLARQRDAQSRTTLALGNCLTALWPS